VKPKPISATEVRTHDIIVRSTLKRVRIHPKWLSEVGLTSRWSGCLAWSAIINPFPDRNGWTAVPRPPTGAGRGAEPGGETRSPPG
jgi:hypothetical protein